MQTAAHHKMSSVAREIDKLAEISHYPKDEFMHYLMGTKVLDPIDNLTFLDGIQPSVAISGSQRIWADGVNAYHLRFAGAVTRLFVFDITDPTLLSEIASYDLVAGFAVNQAGARAITGDGTTLYISSSGGGGGSGVLGIYDITNPLAITQTATINLGANTITGESLIKSGIYVYMPFNKTCAVIDVSVPALPVLAASIVVTTPLSFCLDIAIEGNTIWLATQGGPNTLESWDITNPLAPAHLITWTPANDPNHIYVSQGILASIDDLPGQLDLYDGATGALLGSISGGANVGIPQDVWLNADASRAIVSGGNSLSTKLATIDISDPTAPVLISKLSGVQLPPPIFPELVSAGDGKYIFVINGTLYQGQGKVRVLPTDTFEWFLSVDAAAPVPAKTIATFTVPINAVYIVTFISLRSYPTYNETDLVLAGGGDYRADEFDIDGTTQAWLTVNGEPIMATDTVPSSFCNRPILKIFTQGNVVEFRVQRVGTIPQAMELQATFSGYLAPVNNHETIDETTRWQSVYT